MLHIYSPLGPVPISDIYEVYFVQEDGDGDWPRNVLFCCEKKLICLGKIKKKNNKKIKILNSPKSWQLVIDEFWSHVGK